MKIKDINIEPGRAICYSGFREGQAPGAVYPSYDQIKEDLLILQGHWKYLRLYDCDEHTDIVLEVINNEKLDFKVMLGAYIVAEMNNFGCPWGGTYPPEELAANKENNLFQIKKLIKKANAYPSIVCSLSVGNEATVHWTDHYVPVDSVIEYVRMVKKECKQAVTFCENYVPWHDKLKRLVDEVDFISIHTYPVWEYKHIHESLEYTKQNYYGIADKYPHKPVVITEAGWATNSNGRGIDPGNVSEDLQSIYYNDLVDWSDKEGILTFVFEAFDEPWKGSPDANEPEKHWGLFTVDRKPKKVMNHLL
ncbi:glycoside hydrolase family 17 protein [Labilibacter marinus]|uniref:glycoside hydrolase family 17 protein n=1 Tax=Labilibacter marinus TaxID=1477105 RepID=UPI0018E9A58B|nr:glycosyl hydrolase family 17 protein [Labilibacter marinus]